MFYFPMLLPILWTAIIIYVVFRIVNYWLDKYLDVKRSQNELFSKLIEVLDKRNSKNDSE